MRPTIAEKLWRVNGDGRKLNDFRAMRGVCPVLGALMNMP